MGDDSNGLSRRDFVRGIGTAGAVSVSGVAGCLGIGGGGGIGGGPQTYTVAALVPQSGQYSDVGQAMQRGYEFGASSENADATVAEFFDSAEFNLEVVDDESSADTVTSQLESIDDESEINMVWAGYGNGPSQAAAEFAEEQGVLCLAPYFPFEQPQIDGEYEWTYATGPNSRNIAIGTAGMLDDMPEEDRPSSVAIWEPDSDWGAEMADAWEQYLGEADYEYEVATRTTFEAGSEDLSGPVSEAMDAEAEVVLSNASLASATAAVEEMQSAGYAPTLAQLSWGADRPTWWDELGTTGQYVVSTPGWVQGSTRNGTIGFLERFGNTHGYSATEGDLIPPAAGSAWAVTQLVRIAFQENDPFNAEDVRDKIDEREFQTCVGQLDYSEGEYGVPAAAGFGALPGQWWQDEEFGAGQRHAWLDGESYSGIQLQYPMPAWSER